MGVTSFCGKPGTGKTTAVNLVLDKTVSYLFLILQPLEDLDQATEGIYMYKPMYVQERNIHIVTLDFESF